MISDELEHDYIVKTVYRIGKGNPGSTAVLMRILNDFGMMDFECLCYDFEKKKILGSEVWRQYKDECGEDLFKFVKKIWSGAEGYIDQRIQEIKQE